MESRLRLLLLIPALVLALPGCAVFKHRGSDTTAGAPAATSAETSATTASAPTTTDVTKPVIEPQVERRQIKVPKIDTEDFELGAYAGVLSIEDFGSNSVVGLRLAYHITESFFLEGNAGRSRGGKTSYEQLSGAAQLLTDSEREYTYYSLSAGWNALPGEVFVGKNRAYNSALYFLFGVGDTKFGGDNRFTANGGFGYRILLTDWLATHLDFRDYLFDSDLLGAKKVTNNLEASLGLTVFF
jgi:outer membrane beta-barrel protein